MFSSLNKFSPENTAMQCLAKTKGKGGYFCFETYNKLLVQVASMQFIFTIFVLNELI